MQPPLLRMMVDGRLANRSDEILSLLLLRRRLGPALLGPLHALGQHSLDPPD
jgi:hypothetical protein